MKDFRVGYLYSLSPIHCGGEGDLGNILEIAREVHTNFPYIPGSSLRGGIREDVKSYAGPDSADRLFGKELGDDGKMGVHQVWFGDARLLWVPMRTMSKQGTDVFQWVSCPTLLRNHAILSQQAFHSFSGAVGDESGDYLVADAGVTVNALNEPQKKALNLLGTWPTNLGVSTQKTWEKSRIVLPDSDFQILLEHALWTQIRNKIQDKTQESGGAEVFWTDVCIPRDTIFYYGWGYTPQSPDSILPKDHQILMEVLTGLVQVGGQANVGRGWVQSWVGNASRIENDNPLGPKTAPQEQNMVKTSTLLQKPRR
jgi:CRISPR-associated protein Cmr4